MKDAFIYKANKSIEKKKMFRRTSLMLIKAFWCRIVVHDRRNFIKISELNAANFLTYKTTSLTYVLLLNLNDVLLNLLA